MDRQRLFKSFRYAVEGIRVCLHEQNFKIHIVAGVTAVILGIITGLSLVEWMIVCLVISLVIVAEMFNTAIEKVVDLASPEIHPLAKAAKDIAASAVLVIACVSVIIGILIFIPKWIDLI